VKLVAAVSLTYLMMEDANLQAVKDGVRHVLRMCAEAGGVLKISTRPTLNFLLLLLLLLLQRLY